MKNIELISAYDNEFKRYGRIVEGFETDSVLNWLRENVTIPSGLVYVPREEAFMKMQIAQDIENRFFGGMSSNLGYVAGHGNTLNALEFHKCSEINLGLHDFILFLALRSEIGEDGILDTKYVKAFHIPKGVMIEMFAGTMHYAPCSFDKETGYCVFAACLEGTNSDCPRISPVSIEDKHLAGKNKWLYAHPDSNEVKVDGAPVGLRGENLTFAH